MKKLILMVGIAVLAGGCGNGTNPLDATGNSSTTPSFGSPVATMGTGSLTAFSSAAPAYVSVNLGTGTQNVTAPAAGIVLSATLSTDALNPSGTVTIYHNAHFTTRLSKFNPSITSPGKVVAAGEVLGTTPAPLSWELIVDGAAACPYGYLSAAARVIVDQGVNNTRPCLP